MKKILTFLAILVTINAYSQKSLTLPVEALPSAPDTMFRYLPRTLFFQVEGLSQTSYDTVIVRFEVRSRSGFDSTLYLEWEQFARGKVKMATKDVKLALEGGVLNVPVINAILSKFYMRLRL